jgi:hypothetical protein
LLLVFGALRTAVGAGREGQGFLTEFQNDVRKGYRTNDVVCIRLAAIDKARSHNKPLYAVFIVVTNAASTTRQASG